MASYGGYPGQGQASFPTQQPQYQQMAQQQYGQMQQGANPVQQQYAGAQQFAQQAQTQQAQPNYTQQTPYGMQLAQASAMQQGQQIPAQFSPTGAQPAHGMQAPKQQYAYGSAGPNPVQQMQLQPYGAQAQYAAAAAPQHQVMPNPGLAGPQRPAVPQAWSSGICGCFDDCFICWITSNSPACMYGENYRKIHGNGFCGACCLYYWCGCFSCCFANSTRAALRSKYNLPEEPCGDCVVHWCCSPCAICQEARELRKREGWQTWTD